jgi:hypothetical protein
MLGLQRPELPYPSTTCDAGKKRKEKKRKEKVKKESRKRERGRAVHDLPICLF